MKDLLGQAIYDYYTQKKTEPLYTETNLTEIDEMNISYMFRSFKEMPKLEQKALQLAKGKVLDVGCGAGSHALYLQENGLDVKAIDISPKSVETCLLRGIKNVELIDILDLKEETFDTILLLMNGTGIFKELKQTAKYLEHLKTLLAPNGQILIDSSDIIYLFDEDEDGGKWIPTERGYYGELTFTVHYNQQTDEPFPWLYLDYNTLQNACAFNHLKCELIVEGDHYDYLAKITLEK